METTLEGRINTQSTPRIKYTAHRGQTGPEMANGTRGRAKANNKDGGGKTNTSNSKQQTLEPTTDTENMEDSIITGMGIKPQNIKFFEKSPMEVDTNNLDLNRFSSLDTNNLDLNIPANKNPFNLELTGD